MAKEILRIREILKEKKISGKELAEMVSITEASVSTILSGKTFPKSKLLLKIASVLNVDVKELFHPTKNEEPKTETEKIYIKKDSGFVVVGELYKKENDAF
jgi:transcriptional regulator with XRE-family HTH domain